MYTWEDYKKEMKAKGGHYKEDIEIIELLTDIVGAIYKRRRELGINQRQLAEMCNIPHSSVARIESGKVMPRVETLLKIMKPLGITLKVSSL